MAFDIEMIKKVYANMPARIEAARKTLGRPLTLAEKSLYSHLDADMKLTDYPRGSSYVDFNPDRVAAADATAQMALLQFYASWSSYSSCSFFSSLRSSNSSKGWCKNGLNRQKQKAKKYLIS